MKKLLLLLSFIALFVGTSTAQTLYPYLQTPTSSSIWVSWKTASGTETEVNWGAASGALTNTVSGTSESMTDAGYSGGYIYHLAKIEGLNPDTRYFYKVKTGTQTSSEYSFKTSPVNGSAPADGHVRIVVVGDNQLKDEPRYDSIMVRIKRKLTQKYGSNFNDSVQFILMLGDQVDIGTLDHYENTHMKRTKYLSGHLPIMTAVGNHETYGAQNLELYKKHFVLDDNLMYHGISSGSEYYYAFQIGNVLFIQTSTEHTSGTTGTAQTNWVTNVLNTAATDEGVDFITLVGHRPYTCEQYVGDISGWIRNTVMPLMANNPKCVLEIGAHHHLYHRGQIKESPIYNLISGGTAWDQYWGMSTEQDDKEVQKTLSQWCYQIIDFDINKQSMQAQTFSVGSVLGWKENQLVDEFHRIFNKQNPDKPSITNTFSGAVTLPVTISSSAYATSTNEACNSTQFQVSLSSTFSSIEKELYRDYENFFGMAGGRKDSTRNVNEGVNIFEWNVPANSLVDGTHYVRVRHRDKNLNWSDWSIPVSFVVTGSTLNPSPVISISKTRFAVNEDIVVSFSNGPGNSKDWIGLYKKGDTPGPNPSTSWKYVSGTTTSGAANVSGTITVKSATVGEYFLTFFENDGYTEVAPRVNSIYIGPAVDVLTESEKYNTGETVVVNYSNAPAAAGDKVCIYKIGSDPAVAAPLYEATVSGASGTASFVIDTKAYYFVVYKYKGTLEISNRFSFSVGNLISTVATNKTVYDMGEDISVDFADGPGIAKDWLGIYPSSSDPSQDALYSYNYVAGASAGNSVFTGTNLPNADGEYFVVFFTNDSYTEISNRAYFSVGTVTDVEHADANKNMAVYPNPMENVATIKTKYPIETLEILDLNGTSLYATDHVKGNEFRIQKDNIPSGIYMVKVQAEKLYTLKLIIK
ncbi:MAG: metallophosphoesterase [Cytophagaceae bacterium]|jgi:hypothetical protein|nr:metallophosphoesterase [Cytophagaceae bacterium]